MLKIVFFGYLAFEACEVFVPTFKHFDATDAGDEAAADDKGEMEMDEDYGVEPRVDASQIAKPTAGWLAFWSILPTAHIVPTPSVSLCIPFTAECCCAALQVNPTRALCRARGNEPRSHRAAHTAALLAIVLEWTARWLAQHRFG
jgi:hypothetical protein